MNHDLGISLNLWVFSHSIPKDVVSELDLTVDKVPRQDSLFMKKVKNYHLFFVFFKWLQEWLNLLNFRNMVSIENLCLCIDIVL